MIQPEPAPRDNKSESGPESVSGRVIQPDTLGPQVEKALAWLTLYPDLQGLSLRKAAATAGVSLATMQRAIQARKDAQQPLL